MTTKKAFEDSLPFYPYGVQYYRAPTPPPAEWKGDLKEIAKAGYTHVQYRPQWRWHERIRGRYGWDDLDRLFDLAQANGLRVILKPMLETAPDWVFAELNGTRVGFHGIPIDPFALGAFYVGGWLPCFDNPEVVKSACNFVRTLVERYAKHPALWFYNAWNEPRSRPLGQCQCVHSIKSYREWLKQRFGSVEKLNSFGGKAWTSFETLMPSCSGWDYLELFLWRQWAVAAVADHVRLVADTIRQADPGKPVMAHVGCSSIVQDVICDASDDRLNARVVDRYGTSMGIRLWPKNLYEYGATDYQSDWVRRIDPRYWCQEYYPNRANWCKPPEPDTLNRLIWMAIAAGPAGFTFWQYRSERVGNETNDAGLCEIDGSATERSRVAEGIAGILKKYGSRLNGTRRVKARIGLLYNRESDLVSRIQRVTSHDLAHESDNVEYPYKKGLKGLHALYLAAGETVEWICPGDSLEGIDLLHITGDEMTGADTAEWLRHFVKGGGKLIVDFPFACRDANTWVSPQRPNHGLGDLLGCMEAQRIRCDGPQIDYAEFTNGAKAPAVLWKFILAPQKGKVLARWPDGSAAAIMHEYGKGKVCSLGVSPAQAKIKNPAENYDQLLRGFLVQLGMKTDAAGQDGSLWVRRRRGADREIWFVFNLADSTRELVLPSVPKAVWQSRGTSADENKLNLSPGAVWVAEMPFTKQENAT